MRVNFPPIFVFVAAIGLMALVSSARADPPDAGASDLAKLKAALADDTLPARADEFESKLKYILSDVSKADPAEVARLGAARTFCRYFARIDKPTEQDKQVLSSLLDRPKFFGTLMPAITAFDPPDGLLAVLHAMRPEFERDAERIPDLATAFCVVWDSPTLTSDPPPLKEGERPADPLIRPTRWDHARWLWKYYTTGRAPFRFEVKELPWQLAAYLVENPASEAETVWAIARYTRASVLGTSYFDVPYDMAAYYSGADKKIKGTDYTLPNLMKIGGMCLDQAYYASTVCRIFGVPATVVTGQGGAGGVRHAWVGFLANQNKRLDWNFREGRYIEQLYWTGTVSDPQTRQDVTDADVGLLAELRGKSVEDRLASIALIRCYDLAPEGQKFALAARAVDLSPGNRDAWLRAAEVCAQLKADVKQTDLLREVVTKFALASYPDFAYAILTHAASGRGALQQLDALEAMKPLFRQRVDLQASLRISQANILRQNKQLDRAMKLYGEVLTDYSLAGRVLFEALDAVDKVLRDGRELGRLAAIYEHTWKRLPRPSQTVMVRATPFYEVGKRYESLLRELGDEQAAIRIASQLSAFEVSEAVKRSASGR